MEAALSLSVDIEKRSSCFAFDIPRASFYRFYSPKTSIKKQRPKSHIALSGDEKQTVLDILHSEKYQDRAPYQVYASLLDDGIYHCSIRTMYRLLEKEHGSVKERRRQVTRPHYEKPELLATAPNQVWSWVLNSMQI
ncbi:MAG: hypothetical protein K8S18_05305 [Desulfobacula sp.]|nr:hypothetical protein [Desulfobacula sp.]